MMKTGRLEAFSDGVIAIIITIMVLELKTPVGADFKSLLPVLPVFLTYILSFIYVGIYWNNHHHLIQAVSHVNGKILWANLNLLFWLSLFPFITGWMGTNHFEAQPIALYGLILFMAALSFKLLVVSIIRNEGKDSKVGKVYSKDKKVNLSLVMYLLGVIFSFILPLISLAIYLMVAILWFIPDRRMEQSIKA